MAASRNSPPTELPERVAAFFAPRLPQGRRVCVALSGGRDSVALLQALAETRATLPIELSALHVHHGLSANADAWAAFCADLCRRLGIPLQVRRVRVADDAGEGLEAAARRARYAAFAACDADWLALAHHRDDQAETLLLNLLRGAGVHGLAAMPEERALSAAAPLRLVRPLLAVARSDIERWLAARELAWIDDESNADRRLRRNFLRNDVLPLLATVFPEPAAALARSAAHLGESGALAEAVAVADAAGVIDGGCLRLPAFNALPPERRANLLRHHLRCHGWRMPDARYLAEMLRQLAAAGAAAAPVFALDGGTLRVFRGCLHLCPAPLALPATICWRGEAQLPWAGGVLRFDFGPGIGLRRDLLSGGELAIRVRQGGEHLQPDLRRPRRPLKKLLQESAVPPWQRALLPLLWRGDELLWVAGIGVAARHAAAAGEAGVLPIWTPATRG
ncbi:MAG: tRNA lysidine(34) synthetase TilS [Rhodocyclales bacterium]|nr:tRNA lysidine(34) synthetase TilS [Rhodocyclales bacterium]